ncbi:MAG: guanylate kinase [Nitrospiraceae bacterium]|nr:guanylate kinase [Nitrospiraceae bacterium]
MPHTKRNTQGNLIVISAPSGAGKTSIRQGLCELMPEIKHSVSFTTRQPRQGEIDGVDYSFISKAEFMTMVETGDFLEWAEVHGNMYGTSKKRIEETRAQGFDMILDIDVQGARQVKAAIPDTVFVFILPPSLAELRQRLSFRNSDSEEVINRRLNKATAEIVEYINYNYVIVNDDLKGAIGELVSIVKAERARVSKINEDWIKENFLGGLK